MADFNPFGEGAKVSQPTPLKDALGRVLATGDTVTFIQQKVIAFEVADVTPVFDPTAPPNMVRVTLVAMAQFPAQAGAALGVIRLETAAERGFTTDADAKGAADNGRLRLIGDAPGD